MMLVGVNSKPAAEVGYIACPKPASLLPMPISPLLPNTNLTDPTKDSRLAMLDTTSYSTGASD